jgi:ATP-dependent Clp protease protease subunit
MEILSNHTGKTTEQVRIDCDRDYWMSAEEALEYGIIDEILKK